MICLELFLSFLKIGVFSFGGGAGMIALIRETVAAHGWMEESELLTFIAVSESTPGPIAVNIATFVGASQGGLAGSAAATFGVVLPSFLIILIIASCISGFLQYKAVRDVIDGIRPCTTAMIVATGIILGISTLLSVTTVRDVPRPDLRGIGLLLILFAVHFLMMRFRRKKPSPIAMILFSAVMGMVLYS